MRVLNVTVFLISIAYLVENTNGGVIDNVYGSVENGTQAVKDRVHSWWSFGKDILFGDIEAENTSERANVNNVLVKPDQSLLGRLYNGVTDGYRAARNRIHDLLIDQENGKDKGVIKTMYDRISKRISQMKSYVLGDVNSKQISDLTMHPLPASDVATLRKSLTDFLKVQNDKSHKNVEQIQIELGNAGNKFKEGYEAGKDSLYEFSRDASKRINDGVHATNDYVTDKVDSGKHDIQDSFNDIHDSMNDLTEREKEFLNSIATRLRNRVSNVYGSLKSTSEDLKELSYGSDAEKPSHN
ncbi:unnamed protein product [Diatraea saccharalis]|uniref:Uncharacterized protein n=1 Tax=Diatraea saccharalis TaxID=40085 RepID=A0A9N9QVG5_9NEOP|nr:unnamed protein product [Diatraea saccharalis]